MSLDGLPWDVPVPLRDGPFECLDPKLRKYNVCVDWSGFPAFLSRKRAASRERILFADLQTQLSSSEVYEKMLGSGRSGRFGGAWLKGVGRTPLAGNWKRPDQIHFASGMLPASAAFRERLATVFTRARGLGDGILGCDGILLAALPPEIAREGRSVPHGIPADSRFHALAVKSAKFARPANLTWILSRPPEKKSLAHFFSLLAHFAQPGAMMKRTWSPGELVSPGETVQRLWRAFESGKDALRSFFTNGIFWGGGRNSYTLDGRVIDLETPMIFGRPFLGVIENRLTGRKRTLGLESISYYFELSQFLSQTECRLKLLIQAGDEIDIHSRVYAREFLRTLHEFQRRKRLPGYEATEVAGDWGRWYHSFAFDRLGVPSVKRTELRNWVARVARGFPSSGLGVPTAGPQLTELRIQLARPEALVRARVLRPRFFDFGPGLDPVALRYNQFIEKIDVSPLTHPRALLREFEALCVGM